MPTKTPPLSTVPLYTLKPILIVLISALLLLFDVDETRACTCMPISPSEAFDSADTVFTGVAVESSFFYRPIADVYRLLSEGTYNSEIVYELKVTLVWKGEPHEHVYIVSTVHPCPSGFELGKEYLVYAHLRADHLTTHGCDRTGPLASAQEDLAEFGEGQPPEAGTRAPRPSIMDSWLSPRDMVQKLTRDLRDLELELERIKQPGPTGTTASIQSPMPTPDRRSASPHDMIRKLAWSMGNVLYEIERERSRQRERTPTHAPTARPSSTATLTAAPTPNPHPRTAAVGDEAGTPEWLIPAAAGVFVAVQVGVFAAASIARRRRGRT